MRQLLTLAGLVLAGLAVAWLGKVEVTSLDDSPAYGYLTFALLAIGLYGATHGIEPRQARNDRRLILTAVTVGVLAKALLIGGLLALVFRDPLFFVLGAAVAQIDPLAVAALLGDGRMSKRAKTILVSWSSFDDPVTVLLATSLATVLSLSTPGPFAWLWGLTANLGLAVLTVAAWRLAPRAWWVYLPIAIGVAVAFQWMLAVALIRLFCAPAVLARWIPKLTFAALACATVLLGVVLSGGVRLLPGIALGLAAFAAQAVVAWPLARSLPRTDRAQLALAQQNGITAIILALALQVEIPYAVAVIGPAILVVNFTHLVANRLYHRRTPVGDLAHGEVAAGSGPGEPDGR